MSEGDWRSVHAGAVLLGARAVLIRGASGAGKSRLAYDLMDGAARRGVFARLVADDRVSLRAVGGRLVARAPMRLAGAFEIRGVGIASAPFEGLARIGLVADLEPARPDRLPEPEQEQAIVEGVVLPRFAFGPGDGRAAAILLGHAAGFFALRRPEGIAEGRLPLP